MPKLPIISNPEFSRFTGSLLGRLALVAVTLVPSLYGGLLIWSNLDVTTHLDQVPAAVVNEDEPVTVKGVDGKKQTVALGRSVAASLTTSDAKNNFDWKLTDAQDAREGLKNGDYYAVLTLPGRMSKDATSTNDAARANPAVMDLRTNDAVSYLSGNIATSISNTVTTRTANTVTGAYLNKVYLGFNGIHANLKDANQGAEQLAAGATSLSNGATRLSKGSTQLRSGLTSASSGSRRIAQGAGRLSTGAGQLATGSARLATGATRVSKGASQLNRATTALPGQVNQLAAGGRKVRSGATQLGSGAARLGNSAARFGAGATRLGTSASHLSTGARQSAVGARSVAAGAGRVRDGAARLSSSVNSYTKGVDQLAAACAGSGAAPAFCAQLRGLSSDSDALRSGATQVATGSGQVSTGASRSAAGMSQVSGGATRLAAGARTLARNAPALQAGGNRLSASSKQLAAGAGRLSTGLDRLSAATPKLRAGMTSVSTGAAKVAGGARDLSGGAARLHTGARTLATSTSTLHTGLIRLGTGATSLSRGATELAGGARRLNTGATKLHSGLTQGVEKVPTYNAEQRKQLEQTVANPVSTYAQRENSVPAYGYGLAPYFGALALWVGAMGMFFIIKPLSQRAISSTAPTWRVAINGLAMPLALGILQTLVLFAVLHLWMGLEIARPVQFVALAMLISATFVATNQAIVSTLGTPGRFVSLLFTVLQLSCSGATYPIESTPGFFQALHPFLPLTYAVQGLRASIAGGEFNLHPVIWVLLAWLIGALLLTMRAARSQRTWTVKRLRPQMAM